MSKLRVGLAGAGMVSRHHLIAWARCDAAEVVALADPDQQQRGARAGEFAVPASYATAEDMIAAAQIDALDIAAPMQVHGELVELAARHSIPVLCQKPLAPTLAQARQVAGAADGRIRLMVHENWRFRPHYRQIASWLSEGHIGEAAAFRLEVLSSSLIDQPDSASPPGLLRQPFLAAMDRLMVLELLVHHFDVLRFLFGSLEVSSAALSRLSPHVIGEDTASIALKAGRLQGTVFASMAAAGHPPQSRDSLEIVGSQGCIRLRGDELILDASHHDQRRIDHAADYQASYDGAIAHFVRCLAENLPFETSPSEHLAALEAVERCYELGSNHDP